MVDGNGLENRRARKGTEGSNPSLSAKIRDQKDTSSVFFFIGIF